jgi:raffinose synthase
MFLGARLQRSGAPYHRLRLAQTLRCKRLLACARVKLWWMQPSWGSRGEDVPPETQFLLLELGPEGPYAIILPLICDAPAPDGRDGAAFRATLRGDTRDTSALYCVAESGDPAAQAHTFPALLYIGGGWDPFDVVASAFKRVSAHLGTFTLREDKPVPPCLDVFGWCTWVRARALFPRRLQAARSCPQLPVACIAARTRFTMACRRRACPRGLSSLERCGTPARFLIIDDGWQTVAPDPQFRRMSLGALRARLSDTLAASGLVVRLLVWAVLATVALVLGAMATLVALDYPLAAGVLAAAWIVPWFLSQLSLGALAERFYWSHVHTLRYGSRSWRVLAHVAHVPFVRRRIRAAASALSTFNHRLTSLGANTKFRRPGEGAAHGLAVEGPRNGLTSVVTHAKEVHGVQFVYAWHALCGYWGGVSPTSRELVRAYGVEHVDVVPQPGVLEVEPSWAWDPIAAGGVGLVSPEAAGAFYDALHSRLAAAGVDGVKVDAQALIGTLGAGWGGGSELARAMHGALNESVERHFPDGSVINCMCHSTDNIYHFGDSSMCRASDDFFPRNAASWTSHIVAVAYNSLFFGEVVNPDWDMFHTAHPAAGMHAAARAVGGCAVYVSDAPGKHDAELLRRLVLPGGSVLRALLPGRPTADCLFADVARDGRTALKIWNRNATGGVIGLFNCQGSFWDSMLHQYVRVPRRAVAVEARVCAVDVPGFGTPGPSGKYPPGDYALYCHARRSLSVVPSRTALTLELAPGGWEVVTIVPVKRPSGRTGPAFAAIGLGGMLNSGGAVLSSEVAPRVLTGSNGQPAALPSAGKAGDLASSGSAYWNSSARVVEWTARITLRGGGTFVAFVNAAPRRLRLAVDGGPAEERPFEWRRKEGGVLLVSVPEDAEQSLLELTLESDPAAAYV